MNYISASTFHLLVDGQHYKRRDDSRYGTIWESEMEDLCASFADYALIMYCYKSGYSACVLIKGQDGSVDQYNFARSYASINGVCHHLLTEYYMSNLRNEFDRRYADVMPALLKLARYCSEGGNTAYIDQYMRSGPKSARH